MDAPALLEWLARLPPAARDAAVEEHLGIAEGAPSPATPGEHLVGYHASGIAPIVRSLLEVAVSSGDVVIDLGSGLGKVALLTGLFTAAEVRGIEIQGDLVVRARAAAARHRVDVRFVEADARDADLDDGSVFFLYLPFTGPVLAAVLERLAAVARRRSIVVCALGVDLEREAPWLVRRPIDAFWLAIYDSTRAGALPRSSREPTPLLEANRTAAEAIAFEGAYSS